MENRIEAELLHDTNRSSVPRMKEEDYGKSDKAGDGLGATDRKMSTESKTERKVEIDYSFVSRFPALTRIRISFCSNSTNSWLLH